MRKLNLIAFLTLVFTSIFCLGQVKFYEGDFKTPITNLSSLDFNSEKGIALTLAIDEQFKKYDKVCIEFQYSYLGPFDGTQGTWKENEWRPFNTTYTRCYEPGSKSFADKYGEDKSLKFFLVMNEHFKEHPYLFEGDWVRDRFEKYAFRVVVNGYFAKGEYAQYNEYSERVDYKTKYEYSKSYFISDEIHFQHDEKYEEMKKEKKLKEETEAYYQKLDDAIAGLKDYYKLNNTGLTGNNQWSYIQNYLREASEYAHIDSTGYFAYQDFDGLKSRYTELRIKYANFVTTEIWMKYVIARNHLLDNYNFKGLKALEEKLIQIKEEKRHKQLTEKLEGMEDGATIVKTIMEY